MVLPAKAHSMTYSAVFSVKISLPDIVYVLTKIVVLHVSVKIRRLAEINSLAALCTGLSERLMGLQSLNYITRSLSEPPRRALTPGLACSVLATAPVFCAFATRYISRKMMTAYTLLCHKACYLSLKITPSFACKKSRNSFVAQQRKNPANHIAEGLGGIL